MRKSAYLQFGLVLLLFLITIPYPIISFGLDNGIFFPLFEKFEIYILSEIFKAELIKSAYSDGILLYFHFAICSFIAILFYHLFFKRKENLENILHLVLSYILAYFLFRYSADKIFFNQFPKPEGNLIFTELGSISKDLLFWTTMSTSAVYNIFMGILELLPAILLLSSRTRKFGSLIAFGVLLNIFLVNIGFNISVKLLSFTLLLIAGYLLIFYRKELFQFFIQSNNLYCLKRQGAQLVQQKTIKSILLILFFAFTSFESIYPYVSYNNVNSTDDLYGSYDVNESEKFKRIHIHTDNYLIFEGLGGKFRSNEILYMNKTVNETLIRTKNNSFSLLQTKNGLFIKSEQSVLKLSKLDLSNFPIYQDDFHFTLEEQIKSEN